MATVLITGVGGFVGSHVLEAVLERTEHDVIGIESFRHNGAADNVVEVLDRPEADWRGAMSWTRRTRILTHDMTTPFSNRERGLLRDVTHVINVASRCHVGESIEDPANFVRNNVNLMVELLEWARGANSFGRPALRSFIQLSTDEVFGPASYRDHPDPNQHGPSSPYAASKAMQEDLCHAYRATYGLPVHIVNSANMFGERQSLLAFIPRVIRAVTRGDVVDIHAIYDRPGTRWYSYVRNVAAFIADLTSWNRSAGARIPGRILLPGQQRFDILDLARQVAALCGGELKYRLVDGQSVRPGWDPSYAPLAGENHWADWAEEPITVEQGLRNTVKSALADTSWMDDT